MTSLGILLSLMQPHPGGDTGPSWTWAPAVPSAILVPVCIWQLDQKEPARARQGEGGVVIQLRAQHSQVPCGSIVVSHVSEKRETGRTLSHPAGWAQVFIHSLAPASRIV